MGELDRWADDVDRLEQAGLDVLTVCMDEPTDDPAADRIRIAAVVKQLNLPFDVAVGDQQLVETLNVFQRAFIGRQSDLPLPSSLLIDAEGQLAAIYKGPVEVDQLIRDAELLGKSSDRIFAGAIPFPGKWLERPPTIKPRQAAVAMLEHGYQDAAADYANQLLSRLDLDAAELANDPDALKAVKQEHASLHQLIGAIAFDRQQYDAARRHYEASLTATPHNRSLRRELYRTLMHVGELEQAAEQLEELLSGYAEDAETLNDLARLRTKLGQQDAAIRLFEKSLELKPGPAVRFEMANALRDSKRYADAVREYRAVMAAIPSPAVLNNLAWLLATASDDTIRDGEEAVRLAEKACEVTSRKAPQILGTLAAAYAEQGSFSRAVESVQHAIQQADASDTTLIADLRKRQQDYQNKRPTRD
jgi:tetratricopeptide (TPR) repeat protein